MYLDEIVNPRINNKLYNDIFKSNDGYGIFYAVRMLCLQQYNIINAITKMQNQWQNIKYIDINYSKQHANFASSQNVFRSMYYQYLENPNEYEIDVTIIAKELYYRRFYF